MSLVRSSGWGLGLALLLGSSSGFAESSPGNCWTSRAPAQLIDVDGNGKIRGAWNLPRGLMLERLRQVKVETGVLLPGYDLLTARQVCAGNPSGAFRTGGAVCRYAKPATLFRVLRQQSLTGGVPLV